MMATVRRIVCTVSLCGAWLSLATPPSPAATDLLTGASPFPASANCIRTTVARVTTRLAMTDPKTGRDVPVPDSGYDVIFAGKLPDPYVGTIRPTVVTYQTDPINRVIARERPGDLVQVCAVAFPEYEHPLAPSGPGCDPVKDSRGRRFRVYEYATKRAYLGFGSEHLCGGA